MTQSVDPQMQFRRAELDDAAAIAKVLYESFIEYKYLYTESGFAATVLAPAQILIRMQEGPVWLALRGEHPVGTVAAIAQGESLYVRGMAVWPTARGASIGAGLLRLAEEWARQGNFRRIILSTTPFLSSAIRLYEKSGFRTIDAGPHDLFGTPLLTMEKPV